MSTEGNNSEPDFTEEEVLTIYVFGLTRKRETIKDVHEYAEDHFAEEPHGLLSYGGYVSRLSRFLITDPRLMRNDLTGRLGKFGVEARAPRSPLADGRRPPTLMI